MGATKTRLTVTLFPEMALRQSALLEKSANYFMSRNCISVVILRVLNTDVSGAQVNAETTHSV